MIGIGTDLVDIERFRRSLERTPGLRERLFRPDERAYAEQRNDPVERYAGRFAAKEAALKALGLGLGGMAMYDIEVVRAESGSPSISARLTLQCGRSFTSARAAVAAPRAQPWLS